MNGMNSTRRFYSHKPLRILLLHSNVSEMLSTIYEWSVQHIKNVFEAKSEDECLRAMNETFAQDIDFTSNGKQLGHSELKRFVLGMVSSSAALLSCTPPRFRVFG